MAFNFFKKSKKAADKHTETQAQAPAEKPLKQEEAPAAPTEFAMKSDEEVGAFIEKKFDVFASSPLKILWNVFFGEDKDAVFEPAKYVLKPLTETNIKLNEINDPGSEMYVDYDDNQREFMSFVNFMQGMSVKLLTEIVHNSLEEGLDAFSKDIDKPELEKFLIDCSDYRTYDEFKYVCEAKREEERKKPFDSQIFIKVSKDKLHAWAFVVPPLNKGSELNEDRLNKAIADNKIIFGINKPLLSAIVGKKKYLQFFEIARGTEVIHGKDGYIIDKFPRKNIITIKEDENGNINYKELNNVKSVHKGELITEIYYPVDGSNGKCIDGKVLAARKGKQPKIPKGKNTVLNDDKTLLSADKDGELVFKEGVFLVNELLTIENDVDNASGNINFSGDVLIKGDVREGFSVKAEGNITVQGTCEGAFLKADGDILIQHGMTGGGKGSIEAGGNLKCIFLENCRAHAGGLVEVDQVMYSEVSSSDSLIISGNKGSVTGGKLIAGRTITAEVIGAANNSYLKTDVVLGATPELIRQHANVGHNLKEVSEKLFKVNQDIEYIEDNILRMPESRVAKLDQLKIQQKFMTMQKNSLEETLSKLTEELEESKKTCSLKCTTVNPIVNFSVGQSTYSLKKPVNECHLFVKDDEVVICGSNIAENITF